jgi:hypothetical protein
LNQSCNSVPAIPQQYIDKYAIFIEGVTAVKNAAEAASITNTITNAPIIIVKIKNISM